MVDGQGTAEDRALLPGGYGLWVIALLTLALSIAIAINVTPWLRGPDGFYEWRWKYNPDFVPARLVYVGVAAALLTGWYALARRCERVSAWLLTALVPIGLAMQLSVLSTGELGLQIVARVLNPAYYGYYPPATRIDDMGAFIDTYADAQADFTHPRLQTHPPGNVVFHWLILRGVESVPALTGMAAPLVEPRLASLPDWIKGYSMTDIVGGMVASLFIPTIGALAVIPLFLLAREALDEEAARRAALLYLLAPSLTLFEPKIDVVYTLLSCLALLLVYLGMRGGRLWLVYLSGLLGSVGVFMSYSLIPLCLTLGLFALISGTVAWRRGETGLWRVILTLLVLALGGITVQLAAGLLLGYEPVRAYLVMRERTARYNMVRDYWYSLFYTPYDLLLFAGIPASALLIGRVVRLARQIRRRAPAERIDWMLISGLVAIGLMILSGVQKAENARVFLYTMPVMVLFAAIESRESGMDESAFLVLIGLTFVQLMVFQAVLVVYL